MGEQARFVEVVADQLQPTGRPRAPKPTGTDMPGQAGQRGRQGEDVGQVVAHRVVDSFADRPGGGRCHRTGDHVDPSERVRKSSAISRRSFCACR
jgi:hypothetical protein